MEKEKSLQLDEDTCFLEWKNIDDAPMRECAAYTVKKDIHGNLIFSTLFGIKDY